MSRGELESDCEDNLLFHLLAFHTVTCTVGGTVIAALPSIHGVWLSEARFEQYLHLNLIKRN